MPYTNELVTTQPPGFNSAAVRELVSAALSSEDLRDICYDNFYLVHQQFTEGMSQAQRIQSLIEYCQRHGEMQKLVDILQEKNPFRYKEHASSLREVERHHKGDLGNNIPFMVPFPHNENFVGRKTDLEQLHALLQGSQGSALAGTRPAGLTGMGGIGKTQLAVEYAYRYRKDYGGGIFCVSPAEPLAQAFAQISKHLYSDTATGCSLDEQVHLAAHYLNSHPDALLILDSVADPTALNAPISRDVIPATLPCRLLFTTQRRNPDDFYSQKVTVLPEDAAMRLLLRHPACQPIRDLDPTHPEHIVARSICAILGFLPLALEIAGAHLGKRDQMELAAYRKELLSRGALPVLDDPRAAIRREVMGTRHAAAVEATLQGQWEALQSADARLLLRVAGQLPEASLIPIARLGLLAGINDRPDGFFFGSPLSCALEELRDTSFLEELREDRVRLHPLVREFAIRQTSTEEVANFRKDCAAHLVSAYSDLPTLQTQYADRGIDALQEDLIAGLELASAYTTVPPSTMHGQTLRTRTISETSLGSGAAGNAQDRVLSWYLNGRHFIQLKMHELCKYRSGSDSQQTISEDGVASTLRSLLQVLQCEAHNLRNRQQSRDSTFFAQQIYRGAIRKEFHSLAASCETFLDGLGGLCWLTNLTSTQESLAMELTMSGHELGVFGVAVTPDGRQVVSASADRTLRVWNLATGREERILSGHTNWVYGVAITSDGQKAISASADGTAKVWSLTTGREEKSLNGHVDWVLAVAIAPDGQRAVTASADSTLRVWDLNTGSAEHILSGHASWVRSVAITCNGKQAISASDDGTLKVWDLLSGKEVRTLVGHRSPIYAVAISPDSNYAISADADNRLTVWDLSTGREDRNLDGHEAAAYAVVITPDGHRAISASEDRTLKLWNLSTNRVERTLRGHQNRIYAVTLTPDHRQVISASEDRTLKVWNLTTNYQDRPPGSHQCAVHAVAVTPDGRRGISASADGMLKLWALSTGKEQRTLSGHTKAVTALVVTSDGRRVVSASRDCTLRVWNLAAGREAGVLRGHTNWVNAVAVTPDGGQAASASADGTLKIWNLTTYCEICTLVGHQSAVYAVAITPDGRRIVSASADHTLKVWNLSAALGAGITTAYEERTLEGHTDTVDALGMTPDGQLIVSASSDYTLRVWNLTTGKMEHHLQGHTAAVYPVTITPDGQRVISASADRTLKIWRLATGQEEHTLGDHQGGVDAMAITADGRQVLSASEDRFLRIWDLATGQEIAAIALEGALNCVAVTPDAKTIMVGDEIGNVYCMRCHRGAPK